MPSDAAFREAVEELKETAHMFESLLATKGLTHEKAREWGKKEAEALARVLALYAERERDHLAALEQVAEATIRMEQGRQERLHAARPAEAGEEHEVERAYGKYLVLWRQTERWETDLKPGDRVTVRRCGEGE